MSNAEDTNGTEKTPEETPTETPTETTPVKVATDWLPDNIKDKLNQYSFTATVGGPKNVIYIFLVIILFIIIVIIAAAASEEGEEKPDPFAKMMELEYQKQQLQMLREP